MKKRDGSAKSTLKQIPLKFHFTIILFAISIFCKGQNTDRLTLVGLKVLDAFYETFLSKARISVLEADSCTTLVDSMAIGDGFYAVVPRRDKFVLKIACAKYPVTFHCIQIPKNVKGKYIIPKPIYIYQNMERNLDEVTVKASRILMISKGDTIEYNAAAFRMADGSMLDNLVRSLPGVSLDDNGRITVNGEFVSSLLVNGRDFFQGRPSCSFE